MMNFNVVQRLQELDFEFTDDRLPALARAQLTTSIYASLTAPAGFPFRSEISEFTGTSVIS